MSKRNKTNWAGIVKRKQILSAARFVGIDSAFEKSNRELVRLLAEARGIRLRPHHQENIAIVLEWFHKNEAAALKSRRKQPTPSKGRNDDFYKSWDWRELRMQAIKKHGARCQCCGATRTDLDGAGNPVRIVVDHIRPISRFWELRLDLNNLQILCDECNMGKGAWDQTDWRDQSDPAIELVGALIIDQLTPRH